jgi:hypothetical protein
MKYYIAAVLLLLPMVAFPQDAVFSEFSMGMSEEDVAALYPNLRFEKDDAWVSLGNAVFTRCYIDTAEGLYRVESAMREGNEEFINALADTVTQQHGDPEVLESESVWGVDRGNTFDDPNTWLITISQRNGFLTIGKEYKNAPALYEGLEGRPWERYYSVREQGPAGGLVFYDKGHSLDGWRYLEAAPPETERKAPWGWDRYGPFTKELREYGPAEIRKHDYWTSSIPPRDSTFNLLFARLVSWDGTWFGSGISADKGNKLSVRAVRKF